MASSELLSPLFLHTSPFFWLFRVGKWHQHFPRHQDPKLVIMLYSFHFVLQSWIFHLKSISSLTAITLMQDHLPLTCVRLGALCLLPSSLVPNQPSPLLTLTLLGAPHCQVNQAKLFHCRIQDALQNHSSLVSGPVSALFQPNGFTSYSLPDLFLNLLCCYYCLEDLFFSC